MGLRRALVRATSGTAPIGTGLQPPRPVPGSRHGAFGNVLRSTGGQPWEIFGYSGLELFRGVMSIPAFWRGANLMAGLLAQVPWDAYTVHGRDQEELITPRPALLEQPSPPFARFVTLKSMFLDYLVHGNAIAIVASRDSARRPTGIWPVPAMWAWNRRITEANVSSSPLWVGAVEYNIAGTIFEASDVIHIMGPSAPGAIRGFGVLEAHFEGALATAHEQQRQARNMSRHGVPPGYIKYTGPDPMDEEDLSDARDDWMRKRDEGGVAALNANLEFEAVAWNPDQAQLIEARQLSLNEIANLLGLPAGFVNSTNSGGTSLTYSTVDSEALGLLKWTMGEHFENWSQTLSLAFPRGTNVRADMDHFLRGDTQARYNAYTTAIGAGWMRRSEVRTMERLPPVAGIDDEPLPYKAEKALLQTDPKSGVSVPPPGQPVQALASRVPELGDENQRAVSRLQLSENGRHLWNYYTSAEGLATYIGKQHPWTALRDFLLEHNVPAHEADGEATNIMLATPAGRAAFKAHHQGAHHG